jgi:YQGE family putative transporter
MYIIRRLSDLLGVNLLNEAQKKLLLVSYIFLLSQVISGAFINTFIFSSGGSSSAVILFNVYFLGSLGIFSLLQGYLAEKFSTVSVYRIGIVCYMLLYIIILILRDSIGEYVWLAGIIIGLSGALYYVTANVIILSYSNHDPHMQNKYVGTSMVTVTLTSIVMPFITGMVIQWLGNWGYYTVFIIALTLSGTAFVLSFKMPPAERNPNTQKLFAALFSMLKERNLMYVMYAEFFHGLREGCVGFIFYLMFFIITPMEGVVGMFNSTMALIQSTGFYYITRRLNPQNAMTVFKVFVLSVTLSSLVFLLEINLYTIVFAGAVAYFFISFGNGSSLYIISDAIKGNIAAGFVLREVFFSTGRAVGLIFLLLMSGSIKSIGYALIALAATQVICMLFFSRVKRQF